MAASITYGNKDNFSDPSLEARQWTAANANEVKSVVNDNAITLADHITSTSVALGQRLLKSGDSMSGVLSMGNNKITLLAAGTLDTDAARYDQVKNRLLSVSVLNDFGNTLFSLNRDNTDPLNPVIEVLMNDPGNDLNDTPSIFGYLANESGYPAFRTLPNATPTTKGLSRLYTNTGSNTDGSIHQSGLTSLFSSKITKAGDSGIGNLSFASGNGIDAPGTLNVGPTNATTVNVGTGSSNTQINIGTSGTNTIVIGNMASNVYIYGAIYEEVTNSYIKDRLITLNRGGGAGTASNTGFEIEENGSITGYIKTTGGRDGYLFRSPTNTADSSLLFTSSVSRSFTFPDATGTVALVSNITAAQAGAWSLSAGGTLTGNNTITGTGRTLAMVWTALGTTQTDGYGILLQNTTAAANNAQQITPSVVFEGRGWETTGSSSQAIKFAMWGTPVQGTTAGGTWGIYSSVNASAYQSTPLWRISDTGRTRITTTGTPSTSLSAFEIFNSGGSIFSVREDGLRVFYGSTTAAWIAAQSGGSTSVSGIGLAFGSNPTTTVGYSFAFAPGNHGQTSGENGGLRMSGNFTPSGASATFNSLKLDPTINQTSGTSFIRGVWFSPTYTSITGTSIGFDYDPTVTAHTGTEIAIRATRGSVVVGRSTLPASTTRMIVRGIGTGSGVAFQVENSSGSVAGLTVTDAGNVYGVAGTTGMTDGFHYIPAAAGAPSGTPTEFTGVVPMYYDSTNNQFYIYNGAWRKVTLT